MKCCAKKMRTILIGMNSVGRIPCQTRFDLFPNRPLCSSPNEKLAPTKNSGNNGSSSSLSEYNEQYKALNNLDFMTAAKILFTDPPKQKKFGLDFHLVQLFFVCLPSLAVYLVAQYARSEMKKMDAALELKKQAEFEAKAKEMELKSSEERAAAGSSPELLEVKERLDKLEETLKKIVVESKKPSNDPVNSSQVPINEQKHAVQIEKNNTRQGSISQTSKDSTTASSGGKTSGLSPSASQGNEKAA